MSIEDRNDDPVSLRAQRDEALRMLGESLIVVFTDRDREILKAALDDICVGDVSDFGFDYDTEIAPLFVKLGDEPVEDPCQDGHDPGHGDYYSRPRCKRCGEIAADGR